MLSFFDSRYRYYFITTSSRAVRRGIGQCGQQSQVLQSILKESGFVAYSIGLSGHVLVGMDLGGEEVLLDPDYNIFIPHSLEEVENKPQYVYTYYGHIDSIYSNPNTYQISVEKMAALFETKNNWRSTERTVTVGWKYKVLEQLAYFMKWLLPILLFVFCFYLRIKR